MENQNTRFENRNVYEIMWINTVEPDRPQMTIWRIRIACWKQTDTQKTYTYCFSKAALVARKHLIVTLHNIAYLVELC